VFASGGYAYETDTGNLYCDADGDFTAGAVLVGTIHTGDAGTAATAVIHACLLYRLSIHPRTKKASPVKSLLFS